MSVRLEALYARFGDREDEAEKLDDLVIEAACSMASAVNNGGVHEQIEFLFGQGYNEKDIEEAFSA